MEHVDLDRAEIRIVDGRTSDRTVHLSPSAVGVLAALPRQPDNPWVVPGAKPGTHMTDIDRAWQSIRARAELHDVRIHDIRHSFASRARAANTAVLVVSASPRSVAKDGSTSTRPPAAHPRTGTRRAAGQAPPGPASPPSYSKAEA